MTAYYNFFGLGCAVMAVGMFAWAYRQATGWPTARRWRWWMVAAGLSLPAVYQALAYAHLWPETAWYYEARSWSGAEAVVIPVGAAGGLLAALLPRTALVLVLLGTTVVAAGPFLKPVLGTVDETVLRETWTGDVCIQSTLSTCGPASVATVLRALGRPVERERQIARACHSYVGGTEAWYLARYLRRQGVGAEFTVGDAGFPAGVKTPAIVGVIVAGRGHFIALTGREGERYAVGDPMIGPELLTRAELERRYGFTGFALEAGR